MKAYQMIFPSISRNHRNMIWCVWIAFFVWPNVQSAHVQAEEPLVTKTYHIGDLIIFPRGFGELVVNTTCLADPFEWGFNGGEGTLKIGPSHEFTVTQSKEGHKVIGKMLSALREIPKERSRKMEATKSEPVKPYLIGTTASQDQGPLEIILYPVGDILEKQELSLDELERMFSNVDEYGIEVQTLSFSMRPSLIVVNFKQHQQTVLRQLREMQVTERHETDTDE